MHTHPIEHAAIAASQPGSTRGVALHLAGLRKRYGEREVLHGIDLDIAPGEFVAILGPSGCGKSTLLRLLSGLAEPSSGRMTIDGHHPGQGDDLAGYEDRFR